MYVIQWKGKKEVIRVSATEGSPNVVILVSNPPAFRQMYRASQRAKNSGTRVARPTRARGDARKHAPLTCGVGVGEDPAGEELEDEA